MHWWWTYKQAHCKSGQQMQAFQRCMQCSDGWRVRVASHDYSLDSLATYMRVGTTAKCSEQVCSCVSSSRLVYFCTGELKKMWRRIGAASSHGNTRQYTQSLTHPRVSSHTTSMCTVFCRQKQHNRGCFKHLNHASAALAIAQSQSSLS